MIFCFFARRFECENRYTGGSPSNFRTTREQHPGEFGILIGKVIQYSVSSQSERSRWIWSKWLELLTTVGGASACK
jgi:hypothetical protein